MFHLDRLGCVEISNLEAKEALEDLEFKVVVVDEATSCLKERFRLASTCQQLTGRVGKEGLKSWLVFGTGLRRF